MDLAGIEPPNVAMFRAGLGPASAYAEGYLSIFAEKEVTQLVLGYKDNGILYRTSLIDIPTVGEGERDYAPLVREIVNTLTFIKNQYRELRSISLCLEVGTGRTAGCRRLSRLRRG